MEEFTYFGRTLTNQNFIQEEIKSRLKSENVGYHSCKSFVFQFAIQKFSLKIRTQSYNFACYVVWVWNLVAHIEGGTWVEAV